MKMILSKTDDSPNTLNKVRYGEYEIDIKVRHDFNVVNPTLYITNDGFQTRNYNYFELPELGRYYFIDSINKFNDKIDVLECTCDFIETYKDELLASNAHFKRQPVNGEYYQYGEDIPVKAEIDLYESDKSIPEDETSVVMSTVGGSDK